MENKNNSNNGIGSGFLLGILIGIILTLLITTKKGREILKDLLDRGIQKISELEESMSKTKTPNPETEESDYVKPNPVDIKKEIRHLADSAASEKSLSAHQESKEIKPDEEPEAPVEKDINEKGGLQKKINKRLFFRRTQK